MAFKIRRKLVCDFEFLALPPHLRETFITVFRELAVSDTPILKGHRYYIEKLRQRLRIAPEGIYSVHVSEHTDKDWMWRGVFFRRNGDLVFFGLGPRVPDFYVRMSRARDAVNRINDER